jgi:sporulation protein YlmC with PRC-barrel domain
MAGTAGFTIGAKASCTDGSCGEVTRIVLDPEAQTVTHLVIEPRHRRHPGRLVPLDLIAAADDEVRLRCTVAEFEELDLAEVVERAEDAVPETGYGRDAVQGYGNVGSFGVGGSVSGMTIGGEVGHGQRTVSRDNVPLGETEMARGDRVHAVDGEIGKVEGFVIDPADQHVTHVLLQEGHLWGRKQVAIPITAVTSFDVGIRVNLTKKQVEDLPPVG